MGSDEEEVSIKRTKKSTARSSRAARKGQSGRREMKKKEEKKWKRKIEKKLDDINDKLNKILLFQQTSKNIYQQNYPGTPSSPWYERNKVYCDNNINTKNSNTIPFNVF